MELTVLFKLKVSLRCIPVWWNYRKQGILEHNNVSQIPQQKEEEEKKKKGDLVVGRPLHGSILKGDVSEPYHQVSDFLPFLQIRPDKKKR